jgi:beta-lactam-binding protein with PASTA domain
VTPELESVVLRALAKEPEDRFADADEFIAALEAAASRIPSARQIAAAEAAAAVAKPAAAAAGAAAGGVMAPPPPTARPPAPPPATGPPTGVRPAAAVYEPLAEAPVAPPGGRKRWPWVVAGGLLLIGLIVVLVTVLTPKKVAVPNVVGASISVAQQRLTSEGFKVETVRDTSDKPRNTVFGQDPGGGTTVAEGTTVTIRVSEGPAIVNVPDIVGDGRLQARKTLTDAGFEIEETRASSDSVAINRVISQSPDGGSLSESGKAVKIVVSSGPERLPVPSVVGKTEDEARSALDAFKVTVTSKEDDKADPGTVLSQDPANGRLARGSTIRLTVAIEPKQIAVPDVVGRSQNNATKTLSGAGFEVSSEVEAVETIGDDGKVLKQSPSPDGGKVDRGSTVTITVGRFDPTLNPEPGTPTTTTTTPTTTNTTTTP